MQISIRQMLAHRQQKQLTIKAFHLFLHNYYLNGNLICKNRIFLISKEKFKNLKLIYYIKP
jgi:hypothetical protein